MPLNAVSQPVCEYQSLSIPPELDGLTVSFLSSFTMTEASPSHRVGSLALSAMFEEAARIYRHRKGSDPLHRDDDRRSRAGCISPHICGVFPASRDKGCRSRFKRELL